MLKTHIYQMIAAQHLMGIEHKKLTYRYGGRDYRLTDVAHDVIA